MNNLAVALKERFLQSVFEFVFFKVVEMRGTPNPKPGGKPPGMTWVRL